MRGLVLEFARQRRRPDRAGIDRLARVLGLALAPLLLLGALVAGEGLGTALVVAALPLSVATALGRPILKHDIRRDSLTGLEDRAALIRRLDRMLRAPDTARRAVAAMAVEIDGFKHLEQRHGRPAVERVLRRIGDRLQDGLRSDDGLARLDGPSFGVALSSSRRLDLESAIQLGQRLQQAVADPIEIEGGQVHASISIGFALAQRLEQPGGAELLQAATLALIEAQRGGTASIRSYSEAMRHRISIRNGLSDEIAGALDRGDICAHFQPQISLGDGGISGMEALARWHHPDRGLIPPAEFLPVAEQAGLMSRLGEVMVQDGLNALRLWDAAGLKVPQVGVNFSQVELADPRLVDRLAWELDRFDLQPDRLVIEVLETVVAHRLEDVVVRNLSGLSRLGCRLDLDDFGTGHAAITSIRRFSIQRLKIDRSFVSRLDCDPEQRKMVAAILTMAERLGLETLAEGIETRGERDALRMLGCSHAQGFGVARPMPRAETEAWIRAAQAKPAPLSSRRAI
ncbi:bifunctional diguanylate cyclase/phosphodiesterase [Limimaricola variabilis]|uniref:putative bifunctional diguanylate cyclase/phosphodiesterase n=1 Tax=Limimaricola variabilis TaxID=1492771 RepID=UPI002AC967A0|nr:bifunctional diguanylate cyclase/phosphodiesterase [Limimaricola variabilis]WPY93945.1 bifunctional diguanylate cyclase/phosphodiesterase [Limimaricola variabilis]